MLVFCPRYTQQSRLAPDFLTDLNDLCRRDYEKTCFSSTVSCLDLDAYETSCRRDHKDYTVDAAVGVADFGNNRESSPRHLLIELRLGYTSTRHIGVEEMKRKVHHSREILVPETTDSQVCFLYEERVAPQAKSYFGRFRRQDKEIRNWKAMSPGDFMHFVSDKDAQPYHAINDLTAISADLNRAFQAGGLDDADRLVQYWLGQMDRYALQYQFKENDAIASVLLSFLSSLSFPEDSVEHEFVALRKDDVKNYRRTVPSVPTPLDIVREEH